jgi:ATP-dependent Clp protease ATP-binding subunit ClpC
MREAAEAELVNVRRRAEALAEAQRATPNTAHALAALAEGHGLESDLLRARRLDRETILRGARILVDDERDAVAKTMGRAREFAVRCGQTQTTGLHLLFALSQGQKSAAVRTLVQCGIDVAKLHAEVVRIAMGLIAPARRAPSPPPSAIRASAPAPSRPTPIASPRSPSPSPSPAPAPKAPRPSGAVPVARPVEARAKKAAKDPKEKPSKAPSRFALDPKKQPLLLQLGTNLTELAERGELDPVVGREAEVERVLDVLAKRQGNCPCLVGGAGVGKTSVARALAWHIARVEACSPADDRVVIEVECGALLAGTGARGSLAERLDAIAAEVARTSGRVVLFVDDIHALFGPEAGQEAAAELKSALARGNIGIIGATTAEDYKRHVEADPALARRFTPIEVEEMAAPEACLAILEVAPLFASHHEADIPEDVVAAAVHMTTRYMPGGALPDKAIRVLDLAGARARRKRLTCVTRELVADVVSELAEVPVERLLESDGERMLHLEETMAERVVGHSEPLARIARVLRRNASGFRSRRPIGSFLLLGPTGVGKTETAKAIAECLFHSPDAMTRLDMSEYAEPHAIARLVGAPPGYVGHESGGQLTEAVRRRPYQVLLLDEIEKAHRDVLEAFLQVFDEGRMTDGRGRTIDFTSTVIVITSNLGAEASPATQARGRIGFGRATSPEAAKQAYADAVVAAARKDLPPELYNRIDEVMAFAPLARADVAEVARRLLKQLDEELHAARGVRLDLGEDVVLALLDGGGFDPELGARPMKRAIARMIEAPVAELLLRGELTRGDVAMLGVDAGAITVDVVRQRSA